MFPVGKNFDGGDYGSSRILPCNSWKNKNNVLHEAGSESLSNIHALATELLNITTILAETFLTTYSSEFRYCSSGG